MTHRHLIQIHSSLSLRAVTRSFRSGCRAERRITKHDRLSQSARFSESGYVELPYTLPQDSTLFLLLRETTPEIWMRKLDWIAEHGGMVLLDTHPDYMSFDGSPQTATEYPVALYREFLTYRQNQVCRRILACSPEGGSRGTSSRFVPPRRVSANTIELAYPTRLAGCAASASQSCSSRTILRIRGPEEQPRH